MSSCIPSILHLARAAPSREILLLLLVASVLLVEACNMTSPSYNPFQLCHSAPPYTTDWSQYVEDLCDCLHAYPRDASCHARIPSSTTCAGAAYCLRNYFGSQASDSCDPLRWGRLATLAGGRELIDSCRYTLCNMTAASPFLQQCGFDSNVGLSAVCSAESLTYDEWTPSYDTWSTLSFSRSNDSLPLGSIGFVSGLTSALENDLQRLTPALANAHSAVTLWSLNATDLQAEYASTASTSAMRTAVASWMNATSTFVALDAYLTSQGNVAPPHFVGAIVVEGGGVTCDANASVSVSQDGFVDVNSSACNLVSMARETLCACVKGNTSLPWPQCVPSEPDCVKAAACLRSYFNYLVTDAPNYILKGGSGCRSALHALSIDALALSATGRIAGSAMQQRCVRGLCGLLSGIPSLQKCDVFGGANASNLCTAPTLTQHDSSATLDYAMYSVTIHFDGLSVNLSAALEPIAVADGIRAVSLDLEWLSTGGDGLAVSSFSYSRADEPQRQLLSVTVSVGDLITPAFDPTPRIVMQPYAALYRVLGLAEWEARCVVVSVASSTMECGNMSYCGDVDIEYADGWSPPYQVLWLCWAALVVHVVGEVVRLPRPLAGDALRFVLLRSRALSHFIFWAFMVANAITIMNSDFVTCSSSPLSSCCAKHETKPSSIGASFVYFATAVITELHRYSHRARREWFPRRCCGDKGAIIARAVALVMLDTLPWSLGMLFLEAEAAPLFTPCLTNPVVRLSWFRTASITCISEYLMSQFLPIFGKGTLSAVMHVLMVSVHLSFVGLSIYVSVLRVTSLPAAAWLAYFSTVMFPIAFAASLHIVFRLLTGRAFLGFNINTFERRAPALASVSLDAEELKPPIVAIGDILSGESTGRSTATSVRHLVSHLQRARHVELPSSMLLRLEETVARVQPFAQASCGLTSAEAFALSSYLVGPPSFVVAIDEVLGSTRHEARAEECWESYHFKVDGGCSSTARILQVLLRSMDKLPRVRASQRVAYRAMQASSEVLQHYRGAVGSRVSWSRPVRVAATAARVDDGGTNLLLIVPLEACRNTMYVCDGAPVWVVPPDVCFTVKSVTLGVGGVSIVKLRVATAAAFSSQDKVAIHVGPATTRSLLERPLLLDSHDVYPTTTQHASLEDL